MINNAQVQAIFNSIESKQDLENFFDIAAKCGFWLGSTHELHTRHLSKIIQANNPLNLEVPRHLSNPTTSDSQNYVVFAGKCKEYFDQFGVEAAIKERMRWISIEPRFATYPRKKSWEEVIAMGFVPHPDANHCHAWYAYDLSNPLKIRYVAKSYEFNQLLSHIGGPELPHYSDHSFPDVSETDDYIIYSNRKVSFKNLKFATRLRDLLKEKLECNQNLIKI